MVKALIKGAVQKKVIRLFLVGGASWIFVSETKLFLEEQGYGRLALIVIGLLMVCIAYKFVGDEIKY